jgi:hypothetical protein
MLLRLVGGRIEHASYSGILSGMEIVDRTESPTRPPKPALRPFVDLLWAADGAGLSCAASGRELVLPTGAVHIVVRLYDRPLRVFKDRGDALGDAVGCSMIGGARARPYLRDASRGQADDDSGRRADTR